MGDLMKNDRDACLIPGYLKRRVLALFGIVMFSMAIANVQASTDNSEEAANTLFILDASGSMWGQIDGKPKITIAKEVMGKLVPELPRNARIGLIAYGHRRKSDCNDGRDHQRQDNRIFICHLKNNNN